MEHLGSICSADALQDKKEKQICMLACQVRNTLEPPSPGSAGRFQDSIETVMATPGLRRLGELTETEYEAIRAGVLCGGACAVAARVETPLPVNANDQNRQFCYSS